MTQTPKELVEEVHEGRSDATPAIALGGVTLFVGALVAVILVAALLVYFLV